MCNFVARTNWSNIESNYFMHTIIVFDLSYYKNVMITVTFINQETLCCAFVLFSPENYPHKSGAIFHIDLYVFYIHREIPNGTNKLNHVKRVAVFQNEPFAIPYGRMNHRCRHWNKCMLTIVHNTFYSRRAQWLPLINERFVIDNSVAVFNLIYSMSTSFTHYTKLYPKQGNLTGSPDQAYNFLPAKYFDHILGGIGAGTIAALGTITPGSYNLFYIYAPQVHTDLSGNFIGFVGNASNKIGEFSCVHIHKDAFGLF
jgi:hypothetical protein